MKSKEIFNLPATAYLKKYLFRLFFEKLTSKNNINFFLRSNDIISTDPILFDSHEEHILNLYKKSSEEGYDDFFIDIGANIGLSSILVEKHFKKIIAFEPNPLVFKILEVNFASNVNSDKFTLNNFGISNEDSSATLRIPKHNWGGAHVIDELNTYSDDVLIKKDGFKEFNSDNYIESRIDLKNGEDCFRNLFNNLKANNLLNGFIKIDVEGFEESVLHELSKAIPNDIKLLIIFENWNENFDTELIKKYFNKFNASYFNFSRQGPFKSSDKGFLKLIKFVILFFLGRSGFRYSLTEANNFQKGDCIIKID